MLRALPLLILAACVEYEVIAPEVDVGVPNPRDLDVERHEDRLEQVSTRKVDILWVLDSSCSMLDENEALAEWFPNFIRHFEDLESDYHIAAVTTDMGAGAISIEDRGGTGGELVRIDGVKWIEPTTPDPLGLFSEMTDVFTPLSRSAGDERGREAVYTALELRGADNAGFLRSDADSWLHITVVSDEDDASTRDPIGKAEFVEWIERIRPSGKVSFNSIVVLAPQNEQESRGQKYLDLTEAIGGEVFDLNAGDWPDMLDALGGLQAPAPIHEWFLSQAPQVETLEVLVEHAGVTFAFEPDVDWIYDPVRNSVRFVGFEVPEGGSVILRYARAAD